MVKFSYFSQQKMYVIGIKNILQDFFIIKIKVLKQKDSKISSRHSKVAFIQHLSGQVCQMNFILLSLQKKKINPVSNQSNSNVVI